MPMPGDGVLEFVMPGAMETILSLTMRFDGREHTGILSWHPPRPWRPSRSSSKQTLGVRFARSVTSMFRRLTP
jgi:hypothetical protein